MSKTVIIGSSVIEVPLSAEAPNWAPGINAFIDAVASSLNTVAGPFDVANQVINIDSANPGSPNTDIAPLNFPITSVRAAFIRYSVFRSTNSTTAYEAGNITIVYNPSNPIGNKWEVLQDFAGDGKLAFNVTDTGQIQYSATAIAGSGHTGRLTIVAQALLQT